MFFYHPATLPQTSLHCDRGFSAYVNTTRMAKSVSLVCRLNPLTSEVAFVTDTGREIPDCERGCHSDRDCDPPETHCIQGRLMM
jgi:hypothetical protein